MMKSIVDGGRTPRKGTENEVQTKKIEIEEKVSDRNKFKIKFEEKESDRNKFELPVSSETIVEGRRELPVRSETKTRMKKKLLLKEIENGWLRWRIKRLEVVWFRWEKKTFGNCLDVKEKEHAGKWRIAWRGRSCTRDAVNDVVKFLRGSSCQTPVSSSKKKLVSYFNSPFSLSSKVLFQAEEDLIFEKQAAGIPSQAFQFDIPDHFKSFVEKCGCFLSEETQFVASIINQILQCALDLRCCFTSDMWNTQVDHAASSRRLSEINKAQVLVIKKRFDRNMKELHLCHLKSPKVGDFGLSRLWECLNYNYHYSNTGNEMSYYAFSV
ncbi:Gamma-tubulin complex component 6 [Cucumis melo var. makuwa]|uniref:Gamma-tubulin complex component 6 n=1 Tax=Cucumis melo var. makuwa TaxID=1194695 RepID=A0A5D3BNY3_CUCMM|nr:Gamma-tubulin complex component 6 [Cucumis melo var. makuwa]